MEKKFKNQQLLAASLLKGKPSHLTFELLTCTTTRKFPMAAVKYFMIL